MKWLKIIIVTLMLSLISTHYFEELLLPGVVSLKQKLFGEQIFSSALNGCDAIRGKSDGDWIHPATLALTVYDETQSILNKDDSTFPEVLPNYRETNNGEDIQCVADVLIDRSLTKTIDGEQVRYFTYYNDKPIYNLYSPWVSGLAQSFTGQVMLAVYLKTGETSYLEHAREIGRFLSLETKDGGPLLIKADDRYWFSEYASKDIVIPEVLNGHLLALDFLYWLKLYDVDDNWDSLLQKGINATVEDIGSYVGMSWSYYDKQNNYANGKYHRFHIRQLERYKRFDDSNEIESAQLKMKMQLYIPLGTIERVTQQPSKLLLFLIFSFFVIYIFIYLLWLKVNRKD
jgi:hypothetical protein